MERRLKRFAPEELSSDLSIKKKSKNDTIISYDFTFETDNASRFGYSPSFLPFDVWRIEICSCLTIKDAKNLAMVSRGFLYLISRLYYLCIDLTRCIDFLIYLEKNLNWPRRVYEITIDRRHFFCEDIPNQKGTSCKSLHLLLKKFPYSIRKLWIDTYCACGSIITNLPVELRHLRVNTYHYISKDVFSMLPKSLETLDIYSNKVLDNIAMEGLSSFQLTSIDLGFCSKIDETGIAFLPVTLQKMSLLGIRIGEMNFNSFTNLRDLEIGYTRQHFSENFIENLPTSLTYLRIEDAKFDNINSLKYLPASIESLTLSDLINQLTNDVLKSLPSSITILNLNHNHVPQLKSNTFSHMRLRELYLRRFSAITDGFISTLPSTLTSIDISCSDYRSIGSIIQHLPVTVKSLTAKSPFLQWSESKREEFYKKFPKTELIC